MRVSAIILALTSSICLVSQTNELSNVQEIIRLADEAQDPRAALQTLKGASPFLLSSPDTLQARFHLTSGIAFGQLGNSDSSFYHIDLCEQLAKKSGNAFFQLKAWNTRGLVYMGMGQYDKSLTAYQSALDIGEGNETSKFLFAVSKIYGNMGGIHYQLHDFSKAIEVTKKSLHISEQLNNKSGNAYNHLRLALVYNDMDSLDQGIYHLRTSGYYLKDLNDTTTLLYSENTLGRVFEKKSQPDSALLHYQIAEKLARAINSQEEVTFTILSVASIYLSLNELANAERNAAQALALSKEKNFPNSEKRAYDLLYKVALEKQQYQRALLHRNSFYALSDSINGVEVKARVADLETKYETTKKEAEIARLGLENELKDISLQSAKNTQFAMAISGGLFIGLILVFFTLRHKKQKAEKEAQELQLEAVKKRFMELHSSPAQLAVSLDLEELNQKLHNPLTEREFDALKLTMEGKTNPQISDQLFISINTVKYHLKNTYSKMGVGNRKEAFQYMLAVS